MKDLLNMSQRTISLAAILEGTAPAPLDKAQVISKLKSLTRILGPDGHAEPELTQDYRGTRVSVGYRNYSLFSNRRGEEDDDWPEMTGEGKVQAILAREFPANKFSFSEDEKKWYTVEVWT